MERNGDARAPSFEAERSQEAEQKMFMMNKDNNDLSLRIKAMTEKWREKEMREHHCLKQKEVEMDFSKPSWEWSPIEKKRRSHNY